MKNNNTRELNFNFIERQPIATEAYLLLLFGSTDQEKIKEKIEWPEIDILFAPHHGRDSGKVSEDVLKKLNPHIIIIGEAPSQYLNYYSGYNTITQNSAGDIVFDCSGDYVDIYIEKESYRYDTDFLEDKSKSDSSYGHYLGSFKPKNAWG